MKSDPVAEHARTLARQRYARKKAEQIDRRKVLGMFMSTNIEAQKAMMEFDRCDEELLGGYCVARSSKSLTSWLLLTLGWLAAATTSSAADHLVLRDTNQVKAAASAGIKTEWRNDLYMAETVIEVTTNWMPVGKPFLHTNGVMRQVEAGMLVTNVYHRIVHPIVPVAHHNGPMLGTRNTDFPTPMSNPFPRRLTTR